MLRMLLECERSDDTGAHEEGRDVMNRYAADEQWITWLNRVEYWEQQSERHSVGPRMRGQQELDG